MSLDLKYKPRCFPQLILGSCQAPVNDIVKYKTVTFDSFFLGHASPWTRGTKEEKDALWAATYECKWLSPISCSKLEDDLVGISGISKDEASNLLNETLPAPHDPETYMIQLEVFHNLHCLNMLRKTIYPDQYPDMVSYHDNGTINHGTLQALHMGRCSSLAFSITRLTLRPFRPLSRCTSPIDHV